MVVDYASEAGTSALSPRPRTPTGYRDYDESTLARLRLTKAAQAAGLTLAEVRQVVAARDADGAPCRHVTGLLDTHATDLDRRIAELTSPRDDTRPRHRAITLDPAACDAAGVRHVTPT